MGGTAGSGEGGGVGNRRTVVSSRESRRSRRGDDGDSEAHEASEGIRRRGYHFVRVVGVGILDDFDSRLRPGVLSGHGTLADLSNADDQKQIGAEAFAFVNFARFAVPLRIGLALSTTPWIDENIVQRFAKKEKKDDDDEK